MTVTARRTRTGRRTRPRPASFKILRERDSVFTRLGGGTSKSYGLLAVGVAVPCVVCIPFPASHEHYTTSVIWKAMPSRTLAEAELDGDNPLVEAMRCVNRWMILSSQTSRMWRRDLLPCCSHPAVVVAVAKRSTIQVDLQQ